MMQDAEIQDMVLLVLPPDLAAIGAANPRRYSIYVLRHKYGEQRRLRPNARQGPRTVLAHCPGRFCASTTSLNIMEL